METIYIKNSIITCNYKLILFNYCVFQEIPPFDSYQNYNTSLPCYPEIGIFADPGSNINYDNLITYQNEGDINSNKASFLNFESIKLVLENSDNLNLLEATFFKNKII